MPRAMPAPLQLLFPPFSLPLKYKPHPISHLTSVRSSILYPPAVCGNSSTASPHITTPPPPPSSIYIHLPFCRRRCHYCDFPIIALGSSSRHYDDDPRINTYIRLLLREIRATKPYSSLQLPIKTIFFGGGTPSLVPPRLIASVLDTIRTKFGEVAADVEVSMEMDPGTFDAGRLEEMVGVVGVTRISLGVQAFQEELLRECGRAHGRREVDEAIELVSGSYGPRSWSLDLISSLPRQTEEMWEESLRLAVSAGPQHVSVYDLQVEEGTKFALLYTPGEFPLPAEAQSANFYIMASETLKHAGYEHYEISSYCKPGHECKHNITYWQNQPFYGFGLGSASYINGVRFSRPRRLKQYEEFVKDLEAGHMSAKNNASIVVDKEMAMDVVMLSLRTAKGLDLKSFQRSFGESLVLSLCRAWRPHVESGHVVALDEERKAISIGKFDLELNGDCQLGRRVAFLRLSDPEGFLMSNELIAVAFGVLSP
ncbi:hypothetical protein IEQ34_007332 [Dendrobium chrysotoxum]|uniref:Radical S-adenosyl methionine domain-containing protein 1, mitochondrial n=1 Tax=Dendrobium chrysotoxum TaxID=161865 RepID=A0AAV7H6M3_DENCH|nr:hypothetical protein IEQ34_007332 [Dendrobium chrysotoxum]